MGEEEIAKIPKKRQKWQAARMKALLDFLGEFLLVTDLWLVYDTIFGNCSNEDLPGLSR